MDPAMIYYQSPFGLIAISACDAGLLTVGFVDKPEAAPESPLPTGTRPHFSCPAQAHLDECCRQLDEYFQGKRRQFDLPLVVTGTTFQKKVWSKLLTIPYGKTVSYREVAVAIKHPLACRAVGGACHRNKLGIIIPCHRVVGSNGQLTGYAGGLERKQLLIAFEEKHLSEDAF